MPMLYRGRPHVLAIARNITADKRAEAERHRFESRLRQAQKMEAIGQLTGGIAHDFNNILASVMGYVVLAEERMTDAGDRKTVDYLGQALASCRRARDLIQQMLTFSRGGRGEPRALSLAAVVRDAMPMLRSALPSTLAIDIDADETVPAVWIDEVQAHQVVLNLAINARDAMPGGGALRIEVKRTELHDAACSSCRGAVHGRYVELRVSDSGKGIDPGSHGAGLRPVLHDQGSGQRQRHGLVDGARNRARASRPRHCRVRAGQTVACFASCCRSMMRHPNGRARQSPGASHAAAAHGARAAGRR